jgi:hypothetical protein
MTKTWRFEIYDHDGNLRHTHAQQTFEQVWIAALDCSALDTLKFAPSANAPANEIRALVQLRAVPIE